MTYEQLMRWRAAVGAMPPSNDEYVKGIRAAGGALADRVETLEAMLDHLEATAEASEKRIADVYDLIYKTRELIRARLQPGSEDFRPEFKMLQDAIYGLGGRVNVAGSVRAARESPTALAPIEAQRGEDE